MATPKPSESLPTRRPFGLFGARDPFARLREEMDEVLGHYLSPAIADNGKNGAFGMPTKLDLSETDKQITIKLDVPGIDDDKLDVSLVEGGVLIRGSREHETTEDGEDFHRMERAYGAFQRLVPLPCDVKADKVDAKLKKGVLTIKLPKSDTAREATRKIAIKSA